MPRLSKLPRTGGSNGLCIRHEPLRGRQKVRWITFDSARDSTKMADRDPITCHVLNTLSGTPAAGVSCCLTLVDNELLVNSSRKVPSFHGTTDSDGRVKSWQPSSPSDPSLKAVFESFQSQIESDGDAMRSTWDLQLKGVGKWYKQQGVDSFWSDITVQFVVHGKEGEPGWRHYHVPVLLGPWNYTTYRGS